MSSSPGTEIPSEMVDRWRRLQQLRARRVPGRCDCQCGRCRRAERAATSS